MKHKTEIVEKLLHKSWILWLLIAGLTILLYSNTVSYGMLHNFDDDAYFADPRINELNVPHVKACFSDYFLGMYQPLPVLSFAVVNHFYSKSMQPQRIMNIMIHCINIVLVLLVIKKLTGNVTIGALTALFFAIHPMHVESVSWISTRSNLMFSAFYLASILAYISWGNKHSLLKWLIIFLCFSLALFSKVTAATLPGVFLLIDWHYGRKFKLVNLFEYLPLFFLSGIFIWVGVQASSAFGHISEMGQSYSFVERMVIFMHALWLYLSKFLVPVNQTVLYLYPLKENGTLPLSFIITGILAAISSFLLIWTGLKLRKNETGRAILFGFMFFLITISIVMPLKWSRTVIIAERYTYLPYIGLTVALLVVLFGFAKQKGRKVKIILFSLLFITTILFSVRTYQRNKIWENPITLFTDVIEKNTGKAETAMGYYNRGNEFFRIQHAEQAISDYSAAINFYPEYHEAFYNRGLTYYLTGNNNAAITDFTSTIGIKKDFVDAYINRSAAYRNTGKYLLALSDLDSAIQIRPSSLAFLSRGVLYYSNLNMPEQACSDWSAAAQMGSEKGIQLLQQYCKGQ